MITKDLSRFGHNYIKFDSYMDYVNGKYQLFSTEVKYITYVTE